MDKIRIAIIGVGGISHGHINQLLKLESVEIMVIVDPNIENRNHILDKFPLLHVKEYSGHKEMLRYEEVDAVVICSPHTLHFKQGMDALDSGCHVLMEKPMTTNAIEAQQLIDKAELEKKVIQVSYQRHFEPAFLLIKQVIEDDEIGKLTSITASLYQNWKQLTIGTWRQNPSLSGGGMLMDSGSHIMDVLLWTTGLKPTEVFSKIDRHHTPVEIDSISAIRFESGVIAGVNIIGSAPGWYESYAFCGENGGIFFDNGKVTIHKQNEEPIVPILPTQQTNTDKSFIDAIQNKSKVHVPGDYAKQVIELTERMYRSAGYRRFEF
ncbi:Gfo/Idh/MocA family oxidoreductase [Gracilibacillus sp. YIM 98692]|uniref:Gfo/Idh/MocA family protein n=1 Tax=Gracilibacillus sp. YIM 98692 TaxID=2663532 RepID=UPI0013D154BD|nr:Gfo/Idh/MocA family oxidoreductase [Gracilibacillus sp. YIM 98692]